MPTMPSKKKRPAAGSALHQRPPGELPLYVTPREVYHGRERPSEEESLWHWPIRFDTPYRVVPVDPTEAIRIFRSWNGKTIERAMRKPARPDLLERYEQAAAKGEWVGFMVLWGPDQEDPVTTLLDGYHRILSFARAGVSRAYAMDLRQPEGARGRR